MKEITVGSFPYSPGFNPYQSLFTRGIEDAGLKVVRIPPSKLFPLQRAVAVNCDILHLDWPHDWYSGRNFVTRSLKEMMYRQGLRCLRKKPAIWTLHNLVAHDSLDGARESKMIQALIDVCRGVMVMSDSAEVQLRNLYRVPDSTEVRRIPHGHYIDCYPNDVSRLDARKRLSVADNKFVYLIAGAVKPYKGHADAIRAFIKVATSGDVLVIAGDGSCDYINQIKGIEKDSGCVCAGEIRFLGGQIDPNDFQYLFNAADVTMLPFVNVLNSGSLLLAMSFGSPIIAPRIGSVPEVAFPDYFFGYESNRSKDDCLEGAMLEARRRIKDASNSRDIRNSIVSYTKEKYDWGDSGASLASWYSDILRGR